MREHESDNDLVRLVRGAALAGRSYRAMLDSVLRGECRGHQDAAGKWWVSKTDAQRLAQQRDRVSVTA